MASFVAPYITVPKYVQKTSTKPNQILKDLVYLRLCMDQSWMGTPDPKETCSVECDK